jgi:integrase
MQLRDIFTPDVLKDSQLTSLYAYCLNEIGDLESTTMVDDCCITLKPRDVLIIPDLVAAKLLVSTSVILEKLNHLERLKRITILYRENYYIVAVSGIQFPLLPTTQKIDPVSNIVPINIIDWKHNDISSIRNRFAKNTVELTGISLELFNNFAGSIFLHEVTINLGFEFVAFLKKKKLSPHTVNTYLRTVKASFQRAAYRGYIMVSPFKKVKSSPLSHKPPAVIEEHELEEILQNISSDYGKFGVLMALHTGMRRDEVTNMQWSDVDYESNRILIRNSENHQTKFSKQRYIPLNNGLIELLNQIKSLNSLNNHSSVYLFVNPQGKRFARNYFTKLFERAKKEAGITKKISFHSLRKTFASRLKARGVATNTIKLLLGHSNTVTTEKYLGVLDSDMIKAMTQLNSDDSFNKIESSSCIHA